MPTTRYAASPPANIVNRLTTFNRSSVTRRQTEPYGAIVRHSHSHIRVEYVMKQKAMSRRSLLETGTCALAAAALMPRIAGACTSAGLSRQTEQVVRRYYAAWEKNDWHALNMLLADDFTFTSPNDDHDSKSLYKTRCWDSNAKLIGHFDLQLIAGSGDDVLVMYVCHIKNSAGKVIENVEHLHIRDGKVESVRCYFGQQNSYPAAVTGGQS
jgi:ketosteroid isomerase-like protein